MSKRYNVNDNVIELNVGGTHFTTYKSVLCKHKESMLAAMFSGRHPFTKDSNGHYFIDRDGEAFGYILNFLRRDEMLWPKNPILKKGVKLDLEFFGLSHLVIPFSDSVILTRDLNELLLGLFPSSPFETKLLYRASNNGWASTEFHAACDGKGPTVSLVKVGEYVFGGYTPISWDSTTNGHKSDPNSFIFSLKNPSKTNVGVKFPNTGTQATSSIYSNRDYSVTFGGGHDIHICSNAKDKKESYTNLCYCFKHPTFTYSSEDAKNFFCGSYYFTPTEVEVYSILIH